MGLFAQQPEEPTEWAGLPDEPLRPRTVAEMLGADQPVPTTGTLATAGSVELTSIEVPIVLPGDAED